MLLSGLMLSLAGPGLGDKHSRSGAFGLGGGGTGFDGNGMSSLLGGGVARGACDDGAGIGVFSDGIFGCMVGLGGGTSFDGCGMSLLLRRKAGRDKKATKVFGSR
jgi:hypothetical protein